MIISAKLTSKGQITIPKRVRDTLEVNPGDYLNFKIESGGKIIMTKGLLNDYDVSLIKSISTLFISDQPIIITGKTGSGKTRLTKDIITELLTDKKVAIIDPLAEYQFENECPPNFEIFKRDSYNPLASEDHLNPILENPFDVLIIDEANYVNIWKNNANLIKSKLILISPVFMENDLQNIGDHYSINFNIHGHISINENKLISNEFYSKELF